MFKSIHASSADYNESAEYRFSIYGKRKLTSLGIHSDLANNSSYTGQDALKASRLIGFIEVFCCLHWDSFLLTSCSCPCLYRSGGCGHLCYNSPCPRAGRNSSPPPTCAFRFWACTQPKGPCSPDQLPGHSAAGTQSGSGSLLHPPQSSLRLRLREGKQKDTCEGTGVVKQMSLT